jgi:hypothetical protein
VGRDSVIGVATRHGLDGPKIDSQWPGGGGGVGGRFSAPIQTDPWDHPTSCTISTVSFPGVKGPGRGVGPSLLVSSLKEE